MIARAEADGRGVALDAAVGARARHLAASAGAARVRAASRSSRSRTRSTAPRRCRRSRASSAEAADVEMVWLSDGVDLGSGAEFVAGLEQARRHRPITVVDGGIPPALALAAADNAAGALTREGAARGRRRGARPASCARSISRACRSARRRSRSRRATARPKRAFELPVEIRNDIARARNRRRALRRRGAAARQALAAAHRRRRLRRRRRTAQPLLGVDLLSRARARPVRRCAARAKARSPAEAVNAFPRTASADADPRRRRQCRARRTSGWRAGSRTAACWCVSPARVSPRPTTISCR